MKQLQNWMNFGLLLAILIVGLSACSNESTTSPENQHISFDDFISDLQNKIQNKTPFRTDDLESSLLISNESQIQMDSTTSATSESWEFVGDGFLLPLDVTKGKNEFSPFLFSLGSNYSMYLESPSRISFGTISETEYMTSDQTWHIGIGGNYMTIIENVVIVRVLNGAAEIAVDKPSVYSIVKRQASIAAKIIDNFSFVEVKRSELLSGWEQLQIGSGDIYVGDRIKVAEGKEATLKLMTGSVCVTDVLNGSLSVDSYSEGLFGYPDTGAGETVLIGGKITSPVVAAAYAEASVKVAGQHTLTLMPSKSFVPSAEYYLEYENTSQKLQSAPTSYEDYYSYLAEEIDGIFYQIYDDARFDTDDKYAYRMATDDTFYQQEIDAWHAQIGYNELRDETSDYLAGMEWLHVSYEMMDLLALGENYYIDPNNGLITQELKDSVLDLLEGDFFSPYTNIWELYSPNTNDRSEYNIIESMGSVFELIADSATPFETGERGRLLAAYRDLGTGDSIGAFLHHGPCDDPQCDAAGTRIAVAGFMVRWGCTVSGALVGGALTGGAGTAPGAAAGRILGERIWNAKLDALCDGNDPDDGDAAGFGESSDFPNSSWCDPFYGCQPSGF